MTTTVAAQDEHDDVLRTLLRGCWPSLPALAIASLVVCVAVVVPLWAAPGVNAVSIAIAAVCLGPALAGLVATVDPIALGHDVGVHDAVRAFRSAAPAGLRIALVPAVFAELFLAAWLLWAEHRSPILWPSLGLTGAATLLSLLLAVVTVTVRPALDEPSDRTCWRHAAARLVVRPDRYLAAFVLAGLGVWVGLAVSVTLVPLAPVPVVVVLVAATRTTNLPS